MELLGGYILKSSMAPEYSSFSYDEYLFEREDVRILLLLRYFTEGHLACCNFFVMAAKLHIHQYVEWTNTEMGPATFFWPGG